MPEFTGHINFGLFAFFPMLFHALESRRGHHFVSNFPRVQPATVVEVILLTIGRDNSDCKRHASSVNARSLSSSWNKLMNVRLRQTKCCNGFGVFRWLIIWRRILTKFFYFIGSRWSTLASPRRLI